MLKKNLKSDNEKVNTRRGKEVVVRTCKSCGQTFPDTKEYFYHRNKGPAYKCKSCEQEVISKWAEENQDKIKEDRKAYYKKNKEKHKKWNNKPYQVYNRWTLNIERHYNITPEDYIEFMNKQQGCCAICKTSLYPETSVRGVHLDHCHDTGKVRGILCASCNVGLGRFKDDIELLRSAVRYLDENSQ